MIFFLIINNRDAIKCNKFNFTLIIINVFVYIIISFDHLIIWNISSYYLIL